MLSFFVPHLFIKYFLSLQLFVFLALWSLQPFELPCFLVSKLFGPLKMSLVLQPPVAWLLILRTGHWEVFSKDEVLVEGTAKMTDFMQKHLGLSWVSVEDVQHCFGVLKTNSMKIKEGRGQVIFPIASLLSHSCSPNLEVPLSLPSHCTTVTQIFRSWESWEMSFL